MSMIIQSDDDENYLPSIILLNSHRGQGQVRKGHSDVLQNYNQTWTKLRCSLSSTKELLFPGCAKKRKKKKKINLSQSPLLTISIYQGFL